MRAQILTPTIILALAGCAQWAGPEPQPASSNSACAAVARLRVMDARDNGIESMLEARIFSDTFASCLSDEKHRLPTP